MSVFALTKKRQGDNGVAQAIAYYTGKGYIVSYPLTDAARYDLLVDDGKRIQRVQVKTTNYTTAYGIYVATLTTSGGNRSGSGKVKYISPKECDLVFILSGNGGMYEIPAKKVSKSARCYLGKLKDEYKLN